MGKKTKVGKQRRDKFYHLAKEAGNPVSIFYSLHSNFRFSISCRFQTYSVEQTFRIFATFTSLSRFVCCSGRMASGCGRKHADVVDSNWSAILNLLFKIEIFVYLGVDLVSIKPVKNCITLQGDITLEKTRQAIKKELNNWEVCLSLIDVCKF